ncbi:MAG TPA: ABC transporter ATP-binding protein [Dongiaceae bacterium]|jgi:glycerol transport system ATP-binding protein|nr:ABC transporter ATP-binding protein [Dongiaceae bacterium]
MARIHLRGLAHSYKDRPALREDYALPGLDMVWRDGGAYALLGPSGCGKTTLLNIISGLIRPTRGQVLFDDVDVTLLPPEKRNIAQVFQFPVVYDTMSVYDNLAFPLRNRGWDEAALRKRVGEIAEMLDLSASLSLKARNLGADAKQKISMGRGLVRPDVAAILFDEPLTAIDQHLKWQLRRKLKEIHRQLKLTLIYVTHDQVEAMTFADEVVVMYEGEVVQQGTPQDLFEHPSHVFVGYFVGSPGMNLLPCALAPGGATIDGQTVPLAPALLEAARAKTGDTVLGIRPEFVKLAPAQGPRVVSATVERVEALGTHTLLVARIGPHPILAKLPEQAAISGERVWLELPAAWTILYRDGKSVARSGVSAP